MSLADARVRSAALASDLLPTASYAPYVTAGTITIATGGTSSTSPVIAGLSTSSIVSICMTSGVDGLNPTPVWSSAINNPTPAGPVITVEAAAPAGSDYLFSYIVFKL